MNLKTRPYSRRQDTAFVLSWRAGGSLKEREPDLDYDEVIVCMMLAFCIGNAMITLIYRIMA